MRQLATERPRWGYRQLHWLLLREGFRVNRKAARRLYREEQLRVRRRGRKKLNRLSLSPLLVEGRLNACWSMDFVSDSFAERAPFRVLNVLDEAAREAVALEARRHHSGTTVGANLLDRLGESGGLPEVIVVDNGPEFPTKALNRWAYQRRVRLYYIDPGKPMQYAFVESFNGKFRDECLDEHCFESQEDARQKIEAGRVDYNEIRRHRSLKMPPAVYAAKLRAVEAAGPVENRKRPRFSTAPWTPQTDAAPTAPTTHYSWNSTTENLTF